MTKMWTEMSSIFEALTEHTECTVTISGQPAPGYRPGHLAPYAVLISSKAVPVAVVRPSLLIHSTPHPAPPSTRHSKVTITSKTPSSQVAYKAKYSDGKLVPAGPRQSADPKPCAGVTGTTILVSGGSRLTIVLAAHG